MAEQKKHRVVFTIHLEGYNLEDLTAENIKDAITYGGRPSPTATNPFYFDLVHKRDLILKTLIGGEMTIMKDELPSPAMSLNDLRIKIKDAIKAREEIKERYIKLLGMYHSMVGNLYPQQVFKELMELREAYVEGRIGTGIYWGDLPTVYPPDERGYAQIS